MNLVGTPVVVIGPGRAGTVLGAALRSAGARVVGTGGSDRSRRRFVERIEGAEVADGPSGHVPEADLVAITTPDDVVLEVARDLAAADLLREGQHVIHLAGSRGLGALRPAALAGARTAACHPAQTFPPNGGPELLRGVAWAVTAAPADRRWAHGLVRGLGGIPHDLAEQDRVVYHAGLALGSNTVGAAVSVARQLLLSAGIERPEDFLGTLVRASVENVLGRGAVAITGPVRRGDIGTIRAHLEAVDKDAPEFGAAYRSLSRTLLGQIRADLPPERAAELDAALADPGGRG